MAVSINSKCLIANNNSKGGLFIDNIAFVVSTIEKNEFLYKNSRSVIIEPTKEVSSIATTRISKEEK
jgi:hypothetical protein